jgi:hypothetical protein
MDTRPRGIRNNNPGNIRWKDAWQGLLPKEQRGDPDFCQFQGPAWGIRAIAGTLITYQDKYGISTVRAAITRWAPPEENDTEAYIAAVSSSAGIGAEAPLRMHDYATLLPLVRAIVRHENGAGPRAGGDWYEDTVYNEGLRMAGVVPDLPPIPKPSPIAVAVTTGGIAAAVQGFQQVQPVLQAVSQVNATTSSWPSWLQIGAAALVVVSIGASAYAWWHQRRIDKAVRS